jgi:hypothetical protein
MKKFEKRFPPKKEELNATIKKALGEGKLVELGWETVETLCLENASDVQIREMRKAFYMGAYHLYSMLMNISHSDPEANIQHPMDSISKELTNFMQQFKLEHSMKTEGNA